MTVLASDKANNVYFLTNNTTTPAPKGINKIEYSLRRTVPDDCHIYLKFYEESIIHGQAVANELIKLQNQGFKPDIIIGHSWGGPMFVKEIFPETPYISYVEWYYNCKNSDVDFINKNLDINQKAELACKNSHILQDLVKSDMVITPTNWQMQQIPKMFSDKIQVIHEGINTDFFKPDNNAKFKIPNSNLTLSRNDKVLTYATRGMEEYRGFPQFMVAASILMEQEPDLQVVIAGEDKVFYGRQLLNTTFKNEMLKMFKFDLSRLHFVGPLPYPEYLKLLQVSRAHVYLTYPFILSWSMLEAMATECTIVASNTQPVTEYLKDGYNGILVDFNNINDIVKKVTDVLNNKEKYTEISKNARKTIVENLELKDMLKKQLDLINSFTKK